MKLVRRYEQIGRHASDGLDAAPAGSAAEVARKQRSPRQGNSPNDRIPRGPDCNRPQRVCADAFPATPSPRRPGIEGIPSMRFSGMTESIGPMCSQNQKQNHANLRAGCRLPLVGPRAPVPGRDGQNNTHPFPAAAKPDISTLQRIGHFYFALTPT